MCSSNSVIDDELPKTKELACEITALFNSWCKGSNNEHSRSAREDSSLPAEVEQCNGAAGLHITCSSLRPATKIAYLRLCAHIFFLSNVFEFPHSVSRAPFLVLADIFSTSADGLK